MPELDNGKYDFLRQFSTRQLEALLRADFEESEAGGQCDEELVDKILEVMKEREENDPSSQGVDVDAAWDRFVRENPDLFETGEPVQEKKPPEGMDNSSKTRRVKHSLMRRAILAAAVVALTLFTAACAVQFNLFEMVGKWTEDFFHFNSVATENGPDIQVSEEPSSGPTSMEEALAPYGISVKIPKEMPSRFVLKQIDVLDMHEPIISAVYGNTEATDDLIISVIIHSTVNFDGMEIHEVNESYVVDGQTYTIISNRDQCAATWYVENIELSIRGAVTVEEMEAMIDSI